MNRFDFVIFCGDLNYRINGNRKIMNLLLKEKEYEIMLQNDQLNIAKQYGQIFDDGFIESKIEFAPTYKYDINCDEYDTSSKERIPSWTDRILYKTNHDKLKGHSITNLKYDAIQSLRISDHRPVFAHFKIDLIQKQNQNKKQNKILSATSPSSANILSKFYQFSCLFFCCFCTKSYAFRQWTGLRSSRVTAHSNTEFTHI